MREGVSVPPGSISLPTALVVDQPPAERAATAPRFLISSQPSPPVDEEPRRITSITFSASSGPKRPSSLNVS
jgi:hypothetical protein